MDNKVLKSVRIEKADAERLAKMCDEFSYCRESDVIRAALRVFFALSRAVGVRYLMRFSPDWGDVVDQANFTFHRQHR